MKMKRFIVRIGVPSLLGALSTVLTAWACAAWINPWNATPAPIITQVADDRWEILSVMRRWGHVRIDRQSAGELEIDPDTGELLMLRMSSDGSEYSRSYAGLPFRSMLCENQGDIMVFIGNGWTSVSRNGGGPIVDGIELSPSLNARSMPTWRALPLWPRWPAFVADTIIHAGLWWMLLFGPFVLRRYVRRKRGLCERCAYDLRSGGIKHERCPECGAWC